MKVNFVVILFVTGQGLNYGALDDNFCVDYTVSPLLYN